MTSQPDLVLYDSAISGNAYKVRLLLSHLGLRFERIEFNVDDGSTRTPEFLSRNPNGKVPTVRLPDGSYLFESNAILYYFAEGTRYWPDAKRDRATAMQWMFFEQYSHEPYIAVVRHWVAHLGKTNENEPQLPMRIDRGYHALSVMETWLKDHAWFAGSGYSIADIALYAYTHVAHEGGFDLSRFPTTSAWLARVAEQPGHIRITD
ncbi:glutathione S-transferase family protein [Dongia deserti]|uniref:glutathione S-transferase family protein n=1 Tax=Dongia deserti TaxID=2268030 RepID=UPI000E656FFA|nr:glutathione S-transferase family protein [Dongia deserti]